MKIGIIGKDRKEYHIQRIQRELRQSGHEAYVFPITKTLARIGDKPSISVKGYSIDEFDALIVRRVPGGTAEQVFYRMDALHRLENLGVRVINPPSSIEKSVNKYYASTILEDAGINTPRTIVTENFSDAMKAFHELGGDIVLKPMFGSLGMGMTRISSKDVAYRVFRALEMTKAVYYLQEFVPHDGKDIRVFVIDGKVVASMLRVSDGWKTNISSGGRAKPFTPDKELVELSLRSAEALGLEYTGVDLIRSEDEVYVIELNSTPGWEGLQSVSDVDITKTFVDYVLGG